MNIDSSMRFGMTDWNEIEAEKHSGSTGYAFWKVKQLGDIRIRLVEYSPGYKADHWCDKGHIIYCVKGEMITELKDGSKHVLKAGMAYHVGDNADSHCSSTVDGVTIFIVD
jgi:quercetin dioxygenase-like cupin family protein